MKEINLFEWTKSGEGYEADTYNNNLNDEIMLKLYKPHILKKKIEDSFYASEVLIDMGINTPKAIEMVVCIDRIGVIYERIKNKISLYRMLVNNHENATECGRILGKAVKEFHSHKCDKTKGVSRYSIIKDITCGMISNMKIFNDEQKEKLLKANDKFLENFKESENDNTLLMGDAHGGNVIVVNNKIYFIDLASVQYGDPLLELGWIYAGRFNEKVDSMLPKDEIIPMKYKKIYWNEFIHTYYDGLDENVIDKKVEIAKKYAVIQELFLRIYVNPTYESIMEIY